jgi:hypothetical protein
MAETRQIKLYCDIIATMCCKNTTPKLQCICMVKKIKKKIKTTLEKVSNLSLRLKVLVYIANVCQIVVLKSVM